MKGNKRNQKRKRRSKNIELMRKRNMKLEGVAEWSVLKRERRMTSSNG